jgi:hypothetical protein
MPETTSAVALTVLHLINTTHTSPITANYQQSLIPFRRRSTARLAHGHRTWIAKLLSAFPVPECGESWNSIQVAAEVVCVRTQQSCEPRHHSGIWQIAKSDGSLRSPASLQSSPPLRRRLAPSVRGTEARLPGGLTIQDTAKQDPICHSEFGLPSLTSGASRNADILSTAGRLPDSHRTIPNHAVAPCR